MSKRKFPALYNLQPNDYYKSNRFTVDGDMKEITSDKPIQVRINNGPWINVRPSDLNKMKDNK